MPEKEGLEKIGEDQHTDVWTAWEHLSEFARMRKDEQLYQMLQRVADHLETIPGLGGD